MENPPDGDPPDGEPPLGWRTPPGWRPPPDEEPPQMDKPPLDPGNLYFNCRNTFFTCFFNIYID